MILMLMLSTGVLTEGLLMMDNHFFEVSHFTEVPDIYAHTEGCHSPIQRGLKRHAEEGKATEDNLFFHEVFHCSLSHALSTIQSL
jgi:hypothetical protein